MLRSKIRKIFISTSLPILLSGCFAQQKNLSESQWALVHQAEAYFNEKPYENGIFIQTGNFQHGSGDFALEPGHLCLNYHKPQAGALFVDSTHLLKVDENTGARTSLKIEGTPFVNFLQFPIHFTSHATRIENVEETPEGYSITLSKMYRTKKCIVTLIFLHKEKEALTLAGLRASIAGYSLEALFQNIEKQKMRSIPLCLPPS